MSHFYALVLVPSFIEPKYIEQKVGALLAPYNENLEVPEYDRPCHCVGDEAGDAAHESANAAETIDAIRARFDAAVRPDRTRVHEIWTERNPTKAQHEEAAAIEERTDALWKSEAYIGAWRARYNAAFESHPARSHARSDCDRCGGKGTYRSTYNPKSKWDYWRIGGRWDGEVQGSRRPSGDGGFNFGGEHTQVAHNTRAVSDFPSPLPDTDVPFALVTPDGEWHERGRMGWFASVSNEQPRDAWATRVRELFATHCDAIAVAVDCHI